MEYSWELASWTTCLVNNGRDDCGVGYKNRYAICKDHNGMVVEQSHCIKVRKIVHLKEFYQKTFFILNFHETYFKQFQKSHMELEQMLDSIYQINNYHRLAISSYLNVFNLYNLYCLC